MFVIMRNMKEALHVLNIPLNNCTKEEALEYSIACLETQAVSVVELLTADDLMQINAREELLGAMGDFDLLLPGDRTILEALEVADEVLCREIEEQSYLRDLLAHLASCHARVFLLADNEEDAQGLYDCLEEEYPEITLVGAAKVAETNPMDHRIVNAVNGKEADVILSILTSPLQETFIARNRNLLNLRLWVGMDKEMLLSEDTGSLGKKVYRTVFKHILRREMGKQNKAFGQND